MIRRHWTLVLHDIPYDGGPDYSEVAAWYWTRRAAERERVRRAGLQQRRRRPAYFYTVERH
jgi:hypothetical protein